MQNINRPILACTSETWVLSTSEEKSLAVFERKVLRSTHGPVKGTVNEELGTIMNCTLCMRTKLN